MIHTVGHCDFSYKFSFESLSSWKYASLLVDEFCKGVKHKLYSWKLLYVGTAIDFVGLRLSWLIPRTMIDLSAHLKKGSCE